MESHASMNRLYRLVWNATLNLWVAVAENGKGGAGLAGAGMAAFSLLGTCALLAGGPAQAGLTCGRVVAGSSVISQSVSATIITQASHHLALDWNTFSTRANESITCVQPNAQAIAPKRITSANPSRLLGSLTANC